MSCGPARDLNVALPLLSEFAVLDFYIWDVKTVVLRTKGLDVSPKAECKLKVYNYILVVG